MDASTILSVGVPIATTIIGGFVAYIFTALRSTETLVAVHNERLDANKNDIVASEQRIQSRAKEYHNELKDLINNRFDALEKHVDNDKATKVELEQLRSELTAKL